MATWEKNELDFCAELSAKISRVVLKMLTALNDNQIIKLHLTEHLAQIERVKLINCRYLYTVL